MTLIFTLIAAALFLGSLLLGNVYAPIGAVAVVLVLNLAFFATGHGKVTIKNTLLGLWFVLLTHRSFIPRQGLSDAGPLFFVEVMATLAVLFGATIVLALSLQEVKARIFESRFWLIAYTALEGVSLLWTPVPFYSGFWLVRLVCISIIVLVYFSNADREDCRRFFLATLIGSIPVVMLPIIGYGTGTAVAQLGSHRISGYWVHPGVMGMAAFSVAVASLTVIFQRDNRPFYLHLGMMLLGFASGFLAGGKTGAVGGVLAATAMLLLGRRFRLWLGMLVVGTVGYAVYQLVLVHMKVGLLAQVESYNFDRFNTIQARFELWLGALRVWADSVPIALFGRGFTSFRASPLPSLTGWTPGHAHCSYINVLVDAGVLGAVFFLAMLYRPVFGTLMEAWRRPNEYPESLEFPVLIGLLPLLIGGLVDDAFGGTLQPTSYLTIGLAITLDRLVWLRKTEQEAAATSLAPLGPRIRPIPALYSAPPRH